MEEMNQMVATFEKDFEAFEKRYDDYTELSEKIKAQQNACKRDIKHYKMYIKMLRSKLAKYVSGIFAIMPYWIRVVLESLPSIVSDITLDCLQLTGSSRLLIKRNKCS